MIATGSRKRIVVAMSGGVDSSVTAALLLREGYEVVGVTLQLYDQSRDVCGSKTCCSGRDIYDARTVADKLGIPHYVLDYEERFRVAVIDDFVQSYAQGLTPIPCVACNGLIKFGALLDSARELGAEALATGHYVRLIDAPAGPQLHRAVDPARDQSYFLFSTPRAALPALRFPLGGLHKPDVRKLAAELGLINARKPDSQDICFVPDGRYADVVSARLPRAARPGDIVDLSGKVLGHHAGIFNFTVGQHKRLGLSGFAQPLFVIRLDAANARVVVGPRSALIRRTFRLTGVNWLVDPPAAETGAGDRGIDCAVKVRSMRPPVAARVIPDKGAGGAAVELAAPIEAVAPGQACVFYKDTLVLGGGWIARAEPDLTQSS